MSEYTEYNNAVIEILMGTFCMTFMITLIAGVGIAGLLAEYDTTCEFIAYVIIGGVMGSWAAYGRYLMNNYWWDEEE